MIREKMFKTDLTIDEFMALDMPVTIQPSMMLSNNCDKLLLWCSYKQFSELAKKYPEKIWEHTIQGEE